MYGRRSFVLSDSNVRDIYWKNAQGNITRTEGGEVAL